MNDLNRVRKNVEKLHVLSEMYHRVKYSGDQQGLVRLKIIREEILKIIAENRELAR